MLLEIYPEFVIRRHDDVTVLLDDRLQPETDSGTRHSEHVEVRGSVSDRDRPSEFDPRGCGEFSKGSVFSSIN